MKKVLAWTFWLSVIGSFLYFYKTKPQVKEYCSIFRKRMVELFEHMNSGCCHHHKESETEDNIE